MNDKGSVLIFVLLMISFCVGIALTINEKTVNSYVFSAETNNYIQSSIYAATAAKGIAALIKDDNKRYDSKFDNWANIPEISVENGYITVKVIPVNSKINLSNFNGKTKEIKDKTLSALIKFFDVNNLNSPLTLKDWIDNDTDISAGGLEDWEYEKHGVTYKTKNADLNTIYEIKYVSGKKAYDKMKDVFTSYDYGTKININFASKEVLDYWLPDLEKYSAEIVEYGKSNIYKDISQIRKAANIPLEIYRKVTPYITEKSSFFYSLIEVNLNGFSRYYHSLIARNAGKVKLISFFEGANELYF